MSQRRRPGEIVKRQPGSGFTGAAEPMYIQVPEGEAFQDTTYWSPETASWRVNLAGQAEHCMMGCGDPDCREWANLKIAHGPHAGQYMYHISECQMETLSSEDLAKIKN